MDENNKGSGGGFLPKAGRFIIGKGFYIVLFLCVAAIGISGYVIFFTNSGGLNPDLPDIPSPGLESTTPYSGIGLETDDPSTDTPVDTHLTLPEATTPVTEPPKKIFYVRPVAGAALREYSGDIPVYNPTMDDWRVHTGLDILAEKGESVCSVAAGTVKSVYTDAFRGVVVEITHDDGRLSRYCGLMENPVVKKDQKVSAGTIIGAVGDTALFESLDASHLHFEMMENGKYINPSDILPTKAN